MNKKYTLEEIMSAWAEYKTPVYYYNGEKKTKEEWDGLFKNKHIIESFETNLRMIDRQNDLNIGFPEYLMNYLKPD